MEELRSFANCPLCHAMLDEKQMGQMNNFKEQGQMLDEMLDKAGQAQMLFDKHDRF